MFVKVRRVFTVGAAAFLLFLFTVPSLFLKHRCAELDELCDRVLSGDRAAYETLTERYDSLRSRAELFLDHRVMDDATLPLEMMGVYLASGEQVSLRAAATEFRQALDCMLSIETGDLRLLL